MGPCSGESRFCCIEIDDISFPIEHACTLQRDQSAPRLHFESIPGSTRLRLQKPLVWPVARCAGIDLDELRDAD